MSTFDQTLNTGQQATTRYNIAKIFVRNPRTITASYTNTSGSDETIAAGTLFGQIAATEKLLQLESGASDGSQYPYGLLLEETIVPAGDTVSLTIVTAGDVEESMIVLASEYDDLSTEISGRTLRARIMGDTEGIHLVAGAENTDYDNE